jgi:adenylate cyclase
MTCPGCGSTVQADFAFCPRCGGKLAAVPPASAGALPSSAGEPARTGAGAAAARSEEGDRRLVTVLFADLAGFTALSESLDPGEVRALQSDLFRELSGAIERYDGFVEKFVGDAVMAVFGAPRAHEDDPERALHAALLMHERVAGLSGRWEPRVGRPLALHIGVNTGPVGAPTR